MRKPRQRYEPYLLMAAVRYQVGRETYGSAVVSEEVIKAARWLNDVDKQIIAGDIRREVATASTWASATDAPYWQRALEALEAVR